MGRRPRQVIDLQTGKIYRIYADIVKDAHIREETVRDILNKRRILKLPTFAYYEGEGKHEVTPLDIYCPETGHRYKSIIEAMYDTGDMAYMDIYHKLADDMPKMNFRTTKHHFMLGGPDKDVSMETYYDRPIPRADGWTVSINGTIHDPKGRVVQPIMGKRGQLEIWFSDWIYCEVPRIVFGTFSGMELEDLTGEIVLRDGNPYNCHLSNLYMTYPDRKKNGTEAEEDIP